MNDLYTCAECRETYVKKWSDADADDEMHENFGVRSADVPIDVLCDDCWRLAMGLPPASEVS